MKYAEFTTEVEVEATTTTTVSMDKEEIEDVAEQLGGTVYWEEDAIPEFDTIISEIEQLMLIHRTEPKLHSVLTGLKDFIEEM